MRRLRLKKVASPLVCLSMAAFLAVDPAAAVEYYVRSGGNDINDGMSPASAWRTVSRAADQVTAGDTVFVGGGTYSEEIRPAASCLGTADDPIRFVADSDGSRTGDTGGVVLTASSGMVIHLDGVRHDHLQFIGFQIVGATSHAVYCQNSTGILFEQCEVQSAGGNGIRFDTHEVTIRNCSFHDNGGAGIYLLLGATATIEKTRVYANHLYAGLLLQSENTSATVSRCKIYDNTGPGVSISGNAITLTNCLIAANSTDGIEGQWQSATNMTARNCTIVANGRYGVFANGGAYTLTNSIVANNVSNGIRASGAITHTHNVLFGNGGSNFSGTSQHSTEIVADPLFDGDDDYHISFLSPAVDAGIDMPGTVDDDLDGMPRPYLGGWDIGCFESAPVGHWKLDETSGSVAADASPFDRDGTYTSGPTLGGTGPHRNAVHFDGSNDRVVLPTIDVDVANGVSVALWVKPSVTQTDFVTFFSLSNGAGVDDIWVGWDNNEGAEVFLSDTVEGQAYVALVDSTLLTIGAWQHYVFTIDRNGDAKIYRNGALSASGHIGRPKNVVRTQNMMARSAWNYPLHGGLDDVRLYNRVITPLEARDLYGFVGHWRLDEDSGAIAADSSGLDNDGSYVNGVTLDTPGPYPGMGVASAAFDGVAAYVNAGRHKSLEMSESLTVAAWVRPASYGSSAVILNKEGEYEIAVWSDGTIRWALANSNPGWYWVNTGHVIPRNGWSHVALTYDRFEVKTYVNGEVIHSLPRAGT